ncbi:MAG: UDP-glucose 4-epimerase GalE [Desulfobacterales bacterium]
MDVLVTGGAGYIGAHTCKRLCERRHRPVVFDNLSSGRRDFVRWGELIRGDTRSPEDLAACFAGRRFEAVMHFAALIEVGESVAAPLKYFENNVGGTVALLQAALAHGVRIFVFSSSAAVYGDPEKIPIPEGHPTRPKSPYGRSKAMVEEILADCGRAHGLRWAALRYFNAAGADPGGAIGEQHEPESHLIPRLLEAADAGAAVSVYGTDYPTADGTCIRDYIHVNDLAEAHVLALEHLAAGGESAAFNLGLGRGWSVREVAAAVEKVTGRKLDLREAPRRPGDPAVLVADTGRAGERLGWRAEVTELEAIVKTAWGWHRNRPRAAGGSGS